MRPRQLRVLLAVAACALFALAARFVPSLEQQGGGFETQAVAGVVHVLIGPGGGNIGVSVGPDGVLMVDDQFERTAPAVQAAIDALAKAPAAPRFLINTHFHGDHTGANAVFGKSATIIAQDNVRKRLLEPASGKAMAPEGLPMITFGESLSVHFNGEEVRVIHYANCHTDGDGVVLFTKSNVAHLGDLYFNQRFPFVDHDGGGSVRGLERAIGELIGSLPEGVTIIPGHGPVANVEDLKNYRAMLIESLAVVGKAVAEGKSTKEILSAKLLGKYESLSWQFISTEKWIATLVAECSADRK